MEDLANLFQFNLSISRNKMLIIDVEYILWGFYNSITHLDPCLYKVKKHMYESIHQMYDEILLVLHEKNEIVNLLELMPLIDDYLEYYSL